MPQRRCLRLLLADRAFDAASAARRITLTSPFGLTRHVRPLQHRRRLWSHHGKRARQVSQHRHRLRQRARVSAAPGTRPRVLATRSVRGAQRTIRPGETDALPAWVSRGSCLIRRWHVGRRRAAASASTTSSHATSSPPLPPAVRQPQLPSSLELEGDRRCPLPAASLPPSVEAPPVELPPFCRFCSHRQRSDRSLSSSPGASAVARTSTPP
jgi:hypothetical protein